MGNVILGLEIGDPDCDLAVEKRFDHRLKRIRSKDYQDEITH
jgi:hypothetical protein